MGGFFFQIKSASSFSPRGVNNLIRYWIAAGLLWTFSPLSMKLTPNRAQYFQTRPLWSMLYGGWRLFRDDHTSPNLFGTGLAGLGNTIHETLKIRANHCPVKSGTALQKQHYVQDSRLFDGGQFLARMRLMAIGLFDCVSITWMVHAKIYHI